MKAVLFLSLVAMALLTACATTRTASSSLVEVEGRVTVRGNEPFTAVVLETETGNWYVLDLTPEQRDNLVNPSVQRVVGEVYRGDWNGTPFARLRVQGIERINR